MNARRGHESQLHLEAKIVISRLLTGHDWSVFLEQRDADILVMHIPSLLLVAIEVESSPRNVLRNIERDLKNGCHAVAVVSLTDRYFTQVKNKAAQFTGKIRVFRFTETSLHELRKWIETLAISHQSSGAAS